ncbi:hypothetical protein P691DRAFT_811065 [Macrolepiota fuliginosa MF-IS2]|uniref:Uncharacterized protein n=1 Tax=Macrolepiota fuliginosa MF-IS2 TaxID=1400762 RepID=A0A9P5XG98_9AGAR|nr:hypothetical protein P691DRAFT_811065 [Macrolepiota fuliginosa MF-IS2]
MEEIHDHRATDRSRGPRRGRVPSNSHPQPRTPELPDRQDSRTTDIGSTYVSVSNDSVDVHGCPSLLRSASESSSSTSTPSLDIGAGGYFDHSFEAFNLAATPLPVIASGSMPSGPGFQSSNFQPILRLDMVQQLPVPSNQHYGQGYLSDALCERPQSGINTRLDNPVVTPDFYHIPEFQTWDYPTVEHTSYHAQPQPSTYPQTAGTTPQDQEFGHHNTFYGRSVTPRYVYSEASGPPPFSNDPIVSYNNYYNPYPNSS